MDDELLASLRGEIVRLPIKTGERRTIADGWSARWSPDGVWISYLTRNFEAVLLNAESGRTLLIDPGQKVYMPLEWSPDGRYLLIREGQPSPIPFVAYWVYRLSDGAYFPLPAIFAAGEFANWIYYQEGRGR